MIIHKAIKCRLYPTAKQITSISKHFGCARFIYNYFLDYKTKQYKETGKSATFAVMCKELTKIKSDFPWLNDVSRQSLSYSLTHLDVAFNNFFRKRAKYPKFKSKHHSKQSFVIGSPFCGVRGDRIHLPRIGDVKFHATELPDDYKLDSVVIVETKSGKHFASLHVQVDVDIIDNIGPEIGLDFGIKTFVTTSSGLKIDHPQPLRSKSKKLKRLQKVLSRCQKGSNRRNKQKVKVATFHEKVINQRSDFLHKLSRKLVSENQAIYVEDLNIEGMKVRLGRQINDLGWSEFVRQLAYKGEWYGCRVEKIDRFFPTSKLCSKCGWVNNQLKLSQRSWTCQRCNEYHDRDINAAINVLEYGRADRNLRTGRGEVTERKSRKRVPISAPQ